MILDRSESNRVVVMGDFNFTNIDWKRYCSGTLEGSVFVQCVQEANKRRGHIGFGTG